MDVTEHRRLTVLFADVSGSAELFEALGNEKALDAIENCIEVMVAEVKDQGGTLVKTIGDEIMCTFDTADAAVEAAIRIQERMEARVTAEAPADIADLQVRIGINYGAVILHGDDVFGTGVNDASRMAELAKAGQIVTSGETVELLPKGLQARAQHVDKMPIKGKPDPVDVYVLVWEDAGATQAISHIVAAAPAVGRLVLRYRDKELTINQDSKPVTIGRGRSADLCVAEASASRLHLRIEFTGNRFVVTDDSINGTYLSTPEGIVRLRKKETFTLSGKGLIGLGRELNATVETVDYECQFEV